MDLRRCCGLVAALLLSFNLAACGSLGTLPQDDVDTRLEEQARPPHAGQPGKPPHAGPPGSPPHARGPKKPPAAATDWREEVIYFAMTDRFKNGKPENDDGALRPGAGDEGSTESENPLGWHGGDFAGLTRAIEEGYFQRMGFTALWLSPVYFQVPAITVNDSNSPNNGKRFAGYHGYWAEDFFTPDPHFGGLGEYKKLIATAQKHGIKVIQDMVVNHTGYGASLVDEKPEWFHTAEDCAAAPPHEQEKACDLAGLPDFDDRIPEVRDFLNSTVDYWVNLGIDGIRMDTVKHVYDDYWEQYLAPGGPGDPSVVWTVGEVFVGEPSRLAHYLDMGMPSVFDFPLYFRIKDHLSSPWGNLDDVAVVFDWDSAYSDPSRLTTFIDNHDVPRFMSEAANRGVTGAAAVERLDLALSLIYTVRGTPSVYYGTESAMPGRGDPYSFGPYEGNRVKMDFDAEAPLAARLAALAQARQDYRALTHGVQQELWRPNGREPIMAYRRVLEGHQPIVAVLNNGDGAIELSNLHGGGIPLLGTFADGTALTEVTGRSHNLSVDSLGRLVGTVPPRTLLAVSAPAGAGEGVNPDLTNVTDLTASAGDGAVRLSWTAADAAEVTGTRVYSRVDGEGDFRQLNFSPLPVSQTSYTVQSLSNETAYTFKVVTVDGAGRESVGAPTVSATPSAGNTATVTFTVDARSQGAGSLELRRFDTGSEQRIPMQLSEGQQGFWNLTLELPLLREIAFKFGNGAPNAKNSGYEGDGQPDRRVIIDEPEMSYSGVYDFVTIAAPGSAVTGTVRASGSGLKGATVNSALDARYYYALTFNDGSYYLPLPSGTSTKLTASAPGYSQDGPKDASAGDTDVDFTLTATTKYAIDGNLAGWTPRATLSSPNAGLWGDDNNFIELLVDWDEVYLYLGYHYRAWGNSAIVYLDTAEGGNASAKEFNAWKRRADFVTPVNFFLAQYQGNAAELWQVNAADSVTSVSGGAYEKATAGEFPGFTTEVAIPWATLGYSSRPDMTLNLYAGVFGGDNYGAGDIAPNPSSTPSGDNSIDQSDSNNAVFNVAFSVSITD